MHKLTSMGHTYTKTLFIIYLRLKCNQAFYTLFAKSGCLIPEKSSYYKH